MPERRRKAPAPTSLGQRFRAGRPRRLPETGAGGQRLLERRWVKLYKTADVGCGGGDPEWAHHADHPPRRGEAPLGDLQREKGKLAGRAKAASWKPEEYTGGSFASGFGMFGIKNFPPSSIRRRAAFPSIGAGVQQSVVRDGAIVVATVMGCTLRSIIAWSTARSGANSRQAFKRLIETRWRCLFEMRRLAMNACSRAALSGGMAGAVQVDTLPAAGEAVLRPFQRPLRRRP